MAVSRFFWPHTEGAPKQRALPVTLALLSSASAVSAQCWPRLLSSRFGQKGDGRIVLRILQLRKKLCAPKVLRLKGRSSCTLERRFCTVDKFLYCRKTILYCRQILVL